VPRWLAYAWAGPTTCLALPYLIAALPGGRIRLVDGVIECCGPGVAALLSHIAPRTGIDAMALGHVVAGRTTDVLERTRVHERVHVRQAERWGPLFVPAYLCASVLAVARGGDAYYDNAFEAAAFSAEGRAHFTRV
jgi:hypothetical protein